MNWDDYFMNMAYLIAMKSKDANTHIGSVIVGPDNEVRSTGYNSFPRGILDDIKERQDRPEKYFWFEHSERNAIYNASLHGTSLKGCTMYTCGIPCMDCARGIIQAGIKTVFVDSKWEDKSPKIWKEHADKTKQLFLEADVVIRCWKGELVTIERFQRGEVF